MTATTALRPSIAKLFPYFILLGGFLYVTTVFAQTNLAVAVDIDWLQLGMGLFGGLAAVF